jgi:plasmid maintenance system antidote protein VapI
MKEIPVVKPSEVLREEFLRPLGVRASRLAKETKMPNYNF